jgi:hypothetical protein
MLLMSGEFQGPLGDDFLQLSRIAAQLSDLSAGRRPRGIAQKASYFDSEEFL